jgi:hypothetical protein
MQNGRLFKLGSIGQNVLALTSPAVRHLGLRQQGLSRLRLRLSLRLHFLSPPVALRKPRHPFAFYFNVDFNFDLDFHFHLHLDLDLDLTFGVVAAVPVAKIDEPYSQYPQTLSDWHANCFSYGGSWLQPTAET